MSWIIERKQAVMQRKKARMEARLLCKQRRQQDKASMKSTKVKSVHRTMQSFAPLAQRKRKGSGSAFSAHEQSRHYRLLRVDSSRTGIRLVLSVGGC